MPRPSLPDPGAYPPACQKPGRIGDGLGRCMLALVLLTVLVAGCTTLPKEERARPVDPHPRLTLQRFHADQQRRRERLHHWQVAGVLELVADQGSRRLRTDIQGEATQRTRLTLLGPMQQAVTVLFAGPEELRLVDADRQQIVEVPASAAGLHHLIGIGLQPEELLEALLAWADQRIERDTDPAGGWLTRQGEQLLLDPATGLILERTGQTEAGGSYRVTYQWPATREGADPPMPAQIQVTLLPRETQVTLTARQWQVPAQPFPADWFAALQRYSGFPVERPFQGQ
ncbi:MAG: hypothetical protein H7838_00435 [Magnetococcus sp. DMHC-8]